MSLSPDERQALREGAMKATPGPWIRSGVRQKLRNEDCILVGPENFLIAGVPIGARPNEHAGAFCDAGHIANCSPDRILALLSDLEAAEAKLREVAVDEAAMSIIRKAAAKLKTGDPELSKPDATDVEIAWQKARAEAAEAKLDAVTRLTEALRNIADHCVGQEPPGHPYAAHPYGALREIARAALTQQENSDANPQ